IISPVFFTGEMIPFQAAAPRPVLHPPVRGEDMEAFRRDFASPLWLTYREEFPALQGSSLTSDCGCLLRVGQMMLAQPLYAVPGQRSVGWQSTKSMAISKYMVDSSNPFPELLCLNSLEKKGADTHLREVYHRTLVSWMGDSPQLGLVSGKRVEDRYGPAVVAHPEVEEATDPGLAGITVNVSQDCTGMTDKPPLAVIILIPVWLEREKTNPEYFNFVNCILSLVYCIGIIEGKPKQACYFVGFQDDSLIYMDPHYCQSFVDVSTSHFPLQLYHCPSPKKMPFSKMDPSCTIGFYSRSVQDYERISQELSKVAISEGQIPSTFMQGHGRDYDLSAALTPEKREWPFIHNPRTVAATAGDFVLL
uniref:Cysteine protease n=1 Tax=Hucho hucho TaxID=62062 RepID=A0A4W5RWU5_9TELE